MNQVTLSGRIKNVKIVGKTGTVVTGNLSQYIVNEYGREKCIATMPLVFFNNGEAALNLVAGTEVTVIGEINTRFDSRPGIDNAERSKPYTQIKVNKLELVGQ